MMTMEMAVRHPEASSRLESLILAGPHPPQVLRVCTTESLSDTGFNDRSLGLYCPRLQPGALAGLRVRVDWCVSQQQDAGWRTACVLVPLVDEPFVAPPPPPPPIPPPPPLEQVLRLEVSAGGTLTPVGMAHLGDAWARGVFGGRLEEFCLRALVRTTRATGLPQALVREWRRLEAHALANLQVGGCVVPGRMDWMVLLLLVQIIAFVSDLT